MKTAHNILATAFFLMASLFLLGAAGASAQEEAPTAPEITDEPERLEWNRPTQREDGSNLPVEEIGGYELQMTDPAGATETVIIDDGSAVGYELGTLAPGDYEFWIAVYDTNGLYSNFVSLTPTKAAPGSSPSGVTGLTFVDPPGRRPEPCEGKTNCTVLDFSSQLIIYQTQ